MNKYCAFIAYYSDNNDEHVFDEQIETLKNDRYDRQLMLEVIDALQDEIILADHTTAVIKDMFTYYITHKDEHK